jgi:hypothetical protein
MRARIVSKMVPIANAIVIYAFMAWLGETPTNRLIAALGIFTIVNIGQVENRLYTMEAEIERLKGSPLIGRE